MSIAMILMQQILLRKRKMMSLLERMSLWLKRYLRSAMVAAGGKMESILRC